MGRREQLEARTAADLRAQAREAGLTGVGRLRKAALVERLLASEALASDDPVADERSAPVRTYVGQPQARLLGILISAAGGLGLLLSVGVLLAGPVLSIRLAGAAQKRLHSLAGTARAVAATSQSSRAALGAGAESLREAHDALVTVQGGLEDMDPLLGSVRTLIGDELPSTINATESALLSAQQGAAAMDRVLRGLSFFGLDYDPEHPLDQSLSAAAVGLAPLPESLRGVQSQLATTQSDLAATRVNLAATATDLEQLAQEMEETAGSLSGYPSQLEAVASWLEHAADRSGVYGVIMALLAGLAALWSMALNSALWLVGRWSLALGPFGPSSA
jgi:hypothetical protein